MSNFKFKGRGFLQTAGMSNMSTITLSPWDNTYSNVILGSSTAAFDPFSDNSKIAPQIKKFEAYSSPEDILTLSSTLQRLRKDSVFGLRILDADVVSKVSQDDRNKAFEIRDYYSKKIMMGNLTDKMFKSSFRRDLATFIGADGKTFKNEDIGMACYLPDFYDYDIALDTVKQQVSKTLDIDKSSPNTMALLDVNLTPLRKISKKTKHSKQLEYWFKDDKLDAAVVLTLEPKNQLLKIWDSIFNDSENLTMSGLFHRTSIDGFDFFRVTNWDLVKS